MEDSGYFFSTRRGEYNLEEVSSAQGINQIDADSADPVIIIQE